MSFTSTNVSNVPFRTMHGSMGVVTIEKHHGDVNPNCGIAIFLLVIAIILPASLAAVSPIASILLLFGSTFFPGIPLFLVNKKWRVDIDNVNRTLKITRWHEFKRVNKQVTSIFFDEIREIVAETSLDGTKRRLVALLLTGTRHVLYESMNVSHADKFKNDFMAAIHLQGSQPSSRPPQTPQVTRVSTSPQPGPRSPGPADTTVIVPSLRQFSIPDVSSMPMDNAGPQSSPPDSSPFASSRFTAYVDGVLPSRNPQDAGVVPDPLPAGKPDDHEVDASSQEDMAALSQRLAETARRKREILSRVYQPGTESQAKPADQAPPTGVAPGSDAVACPPMKNRAAVFNEFDNCETLAYLFSAELGGRRPTGTTGPIEVRAGRAPKKKAGDEDDDDEIIERKVDRKTERELDVQKVRPRCMVCTIPLKGTTYICPNCDTKYCIRCARTLASRKEYCWTCRKPLKVQ